MRGLKGEVGAVNGCAALLAPLVVISRRPRANQRVL